jgi:hypothetical protein
MSTALIPIRKPMVAAQGGITVSRSVPQQTAYDGDNFIELRLPPGSFAASAQRSGEGGAR